MFLWPQSGLVAFLARDIPYPLTCHSSNLGFGSKNGESLPALTKTMRSSGTYTKEIYRWKTEFLCIRIHTRLDDQAQAHHLNKKLEHPQQTHHLTPPLHQPCIPSRWASMDMHQKKRWTRNWQEERGRARNNDKTDAQLTKELMYPNLTDEGTDVSICTPLTLPQLPNWRGHRHEPMYPTGRTPTTELTWAQTLACVPHWGLPLQPLVQGIWILTTIINRNTLTEGQTHKGDIHTEGTFIVHGVTFTRRALLT